MNTTDITVTELFNVYKRCFPGVEYNETSIRNAFHAYANLVDRSLIFKCEICKESPEVLIFDGNAKLRCSLPFNRRVDHNTRPIDDKVDCATFWKDNSLVVISRMFGLREPNLNFSIAPIIDPDVASNDVFNTEYKKLIHIEDVKQSGHKELSADIVHEICTKRITNAELKTICIHYGIDVQGRPSNEDMRRRLMCALEFGDGTANLSSEMNKLFPSFNHTNGGFLFGLCEHGVVYYTKFLIRGEGSRDVLDAILSFRNPPKYVIYDDAGCLADHAWKRLGAERCLQLIGKDRGRVLEATEINVERAKECSKDKRRFLVSECPEGGMLFLYDRFHQNNSSADFSLLRYADLVERMKGVNTQHAEEFNRMVRGLTKSLNVSLPHLMYNFLRRIISDMNETRNLKLKDLLMTHSEVKAPKN